MVHCAQDSVNKQLVPSAATECSSSLTVIQVVCSYNLPSGWWIGTWCVFSLIVSSESSCKCCYSVDFLEPNMPPTETRGKKYLCLWDLLNTDVNTEYEIYLTLMLTQNNEKQYVWTIIIFLMFNMPTCVQNSTNEYTHKIGRWKKRITIVWENADITTCPWTKYVWALHGWITVSNISHHKQNKNIFYDFINLLNCQETVYTNHRCTFLQLCLCLHSRQSEIYN